VSRLLDAGAPVPLERVDRALVIAGEPRAGSRDLAAFKGVTVGLWEITPGTSTDVEADEVFVVLSGSATLAFDGGETLELRPGTVVQLRAGDRTTWTVHEVLRKFYLA
jgi:uncharacterized protein